MLSIRTRVIDNMSNDTDSVLFLTNNRPSTGTSMAKIVCTMLSLVWLRYVRSMHSEGIQSDGENSLYVAIIGMAQVRGAINGLRRHSEGTQSMDTKGTHKATQLHARETLDPILAPLFPD